MATATPGVQPKPTGGQPASGGAEFDKVVQAVKTAAGSLVPQRTSSGTGSGSSSGQSNLMVQGSLPSGYDGPRPWTPEPPEDAPSTTLPGDPRRALQGVSWQPEANSTETFAATPPETATADGKTYDVQSKTKDPGEGMYHLTQGQMSYIESVAEQRYPSNGTSNLEGQTYHTSRKMFMEQAEEATRATGNAADGVTFASKVIKASTQMVISATRGAISQGHISFGKILEPAVAVAANEFLGARFANLHSPEAMAQSASMKKRIMFTAGMLGAHWLAGGTVGGMALGKLGKQGLSLTPADVAKGFAAGGNAFGLLTSASALASYSSATRTGWLDFAKTNTQRLFAANDAVQGISSILEGAARVQTAPYASSMLMAAGTAQFVGALAPMRMFWNNNFAATERLGMMKGSAFTAGIAAGFYGLAAVMQAYEGGWEIQTELKR